MKPFIRTVIFASALTVFTASQLLFPPAETTGLSSFTPPDEPLYNLTGLTCISEKLFFPKPPPDKPKKPTEQLQTALAHYGE